MGIEARKEPRQPRSALVVEVTAENKEELGFDTLTNVVKDCFNTLPYDRGGHRKPSSDFVINLSTQNSSGQQVGLKLSTTYPEDLNKFSYEFTIALTQTEVEKRRLRKTIRSTRSINLKCKHKHEGEGFKKRVKLIEGTTGEDIDLNDPLLIKTANLVRKALNERVAEIMEANKKEQEKHIQDVAKMKEDLGSIVS